MDVPVGPVKHNRQKQDLPALYRGAESDSWANLHTPNTASVYKTTPTAH